MSTENRVTGHGTVVALSSDESINTSSEEWRCQAASRPSGRNRASNEANGSGTVLSRTCRPACSHVSVLHQEIIAGPAAIPVAAQRNRPSAEKQAAPVVVATVVLASLWGRMRKVGGLSERSQTRRW